MPTRIRLQRKGKKGQAFYHLVVADGRAPRDGKFIEKLGTYNPITHPATIEIDFDRSLYWLQAGAQPSDTARSILSHKGVLLKDHLLRGMKKGALTENQVEEKFQAWLQDKEEKIQQAAKDATLSKKELDKKRLEEEKKVREAREEALAKKLAAESEKEAKAEAPAEEAEKETEESPATEEVKDEAPAEEVKEEAKKEEEAKAEEPKKEEAPAEEAKEEAKSEEPKEEEAKDSEKKENE
ncbi:MAG: 30S ribosomal protein S16 [Bacteroidota bacterium]